MPEELRVSDSITKEEKRLKNEENKILNADLEGK